MKKYFLSLVCAAVASTAWAQSPGPVVPVSPAPIVQVSGGRILGNHQCAPGCAQTCAVPTKTICVPEPATKVTVHINYSSTCEKVCFPKCKLGGFFGHDKCAACENGTCESHVYQKKYLVKKICTTEEPTTKCVAVTVPACDSRCGVQRPVGPAIETIPVAPKKK